MKEQCNNASIHMAVAIVDGGKSEKVVKICKQSHVLYCCVSMGHGTARTEMLDLLGLGETKKDVVMCLTPDEQLHGLLTLLAEEMKMRYPGKGIAFAVPLNCLAGRMYRLLASEHGEEERSENNMEYTGQYDLVVALIKRGYSDMVMDAARKTGAHGGTVLNTRGLGSQEVEQFLGIPLQAEKELVFMVVPSSQRQIIMHAIQAEAGLNTPAQGLVLSLPVSHAIGLA